MKKYGIYLAYSPYDKLHAQGLGRHLAEFLKGAQDRKDIQFVIAIPSWLRESLPEFFAQNDIRIERFEIIGPAKKPLMLRVYQHYTALKNRQKKVGWFGRFMLFIKDITTKVTIKFERRLFTTRSILLPLAFVIISFPFVILSVLAKYFLIFLRKVQQWFSHVYNKISKHFNVKKSLNWLSALTAEKNNAGLLRWYRLMLDAETSLMHDLINARKDIAAWYCPTAFWPHFNKIRSPGLMCVPDIVMTDFSVDFAALGGHGMLYDFTQIEKAIEGGKNFVTYSEDVKWQTLVKRFHVNSQAISVVPHGTICLDEVAVVTGFADNNAARDAWFRNLYRNALWKSRINGYAHIFDSDDIHFLFYASQFRPNKNVISLLRAYEYLLRRRYISQKLILTGDPHLLPELVRFITEHNLENDVLCLHHLSTQQLAACYRLADLTVNPSLSEGGCPFTFTESLSVGTPVVMARIAVTEEIITNHELKQIMFFDPFDWKDMAMRIEWGLKNRQFLLEKQQQLYEQLKKRTWRKVVDEYVEILDRISLVPENV